MVLCVCLPAGDWCGLPVAVKVMEVQGHGDLKVVRQELAVNKLLEHPNVVRCLAYRMRQLVRDARGWKYGGSNTGLGLLNLYNTEWGASVNLILA